MVDPDGASSGTRWQATIDIMDTVTNASQAAERGRDIIMKTVTILIPMHLAGQDEINRRRAEAGYAMAALIVGLAVMAVMMTVAMPVWKQMVQREKEAELVFRGEQIARSIGLFQRKFANAYPPTLDLLVEQKFLRKKYKDPITGEDFVPLTQGQTQAGTPGGPPAAQRGGTPQPPAPGGQGARGNPFGAPGAGVPGTGAPGGGAAGGIIGVTSKSKDLSIRLYNGRTHYNEWMFVYTPPQTAGAAGPGGPGGAGQRGRGNNPSPDGLFPGGGNRGRDGRGPFPPGGGGFPPGGPGGGGGRGPAGGPGGQFPFPTGPGRGR
jgi:type II secretory pathway pseudopilin PulG